MPAIEGHRNLDGWMFSDTISSQLSSSLLLCMIDHGLPNVPTAPRLKIMALGSLTYEGAWEATTLPQGNARHLARAFQRQTYLVRYHARPGERPRGILTKVANGSASTISHLSSHLGVLEPYWLA